MFSDVYVRAYPNRASELVQYSHLIHTASQSYTWDNVYMYDKDFRLHSARHKDKIKVGGTNFSHGHGGHNSRKDICKHFNRSE